VFLIQIGIVSAQSPGGVSGNLRWWVKANAGVYEGNGTDPAANGELVRVWDDAAPDDKDAVNATSATRPVYRTNFINGNPVLEFNGTKFLDQNGTSGIGDDDSFSMFMVFKLKSYQTTGLLDDAVGTFIIDRPTDTYHLSSFKVVNTNKYGYQRRDEDNNDLGGPISLTPVNTSSFVIIQYYRNRISNSNSREGMYINGDLDIDQFGITGDVPGPPVRIGRHATDVNGGLDGYFAEMVVYNTNLSTANRQRVQSYLALKYGITLDAATDYVRRDGTVIYPSTGSHSGFIHDIAGIGRDNASSANSSAFLQLTSTSQNPNSVVTISASASNVANNEFLVWGSNNGSLTVPSTSNLPSGIIKKLDRIWRVAEAGDVGAFSVTVDLSAVPGPKNVSHLRLLVDPDGFGTGTAATQYTGTAVDAANSIYRFANVSITDDDYFTIGTTNATTTPLPIELSAFNVTHESPVVVATWETASELNNDHFTLEKAGPDLKFAEVGTEAGAGTTKSKHRYTMLDPLPYEGISYYRLKQTDYDGSVTYSEVKSMYIAESQKKLAVFPNPSNGKNLTVSWGNSKFNLTHIRVINQQGKLVESSSIVKRDLREYPINLKKKLAPGLYVVQVRYNGKDEAVKLVVQ
jgi:hypothetical protein